MICWFRGEKASAGSSLSDSFMVPGVTCRQRLSDVFWVRTTWSQKKVNLVTIATVLRGAAH